MTTIVSMDDDADADGGVPSPMGNIRQLAWLPIIDSSGRRRVGLDELFTRAHLIERIDVRAPIEKAGVLRFLTTVTALIARAQGIMPQTAEGVARDGFAPAVVASVLDGIDDRLWLIHPSTPFMQEGRFRMATSAVKTAASIRSTSPGDSTKAWWGRPGDGFATGHLDLASAPAALMGFWFYSVNGNGAVVLDGISIPVQGSAAGKVIAAGVRLWKTGENLAATLLMNTPQEWTEGAALPAWASTMEVSGELNPLIAATITGNATLLLPERVGESVVFVGAHIGSALRRGIPPSAADYAEMTSAKSRNKNAVTENKRLKAAGEPAIDLESLPVLGVDALKGSLVHAWRDDPQVVFRRPDPKKNKGAQKDEEIRALNDVDASTSVLHNLHGWYLRAFNPRYRDAGASWSDATSPQNFSPSSSSRRAPTGSCRVRPGCPCLQERSAVPRQCRRPWRGSLISPTSVFRAPCISPFELSWPIGKAK